MILSNHASINSESPVLHRSGLSFFNQMKTTMKVFSVLCSRTNLLQNQISCKCKLSTLFNH